MRKLVVVFTVASLIGCSMGHRPPVEAKDALNEALSQSGSHGLDELPPSVEADLMPELDGSGLIASETMKRFRIQANDVDANAFLPV